MPPRSCRVGTPIAILGFSHCRVYFALSSHSEEEAELLRRDHADAVFMGEHELALGMTRHILDHLRPDASPEEQRRPA